MAVADNQNNALFTEIDEADSVQVSGGCHHRRSFHRPVSFYRPVRSHVVPAYWGGWSGGYGGGSVNQTVNVRVVYND